MNNFHNYLLLNKIFLTKNLYNLFKNIDRRILDIVFTCKKSISYDKVDYNKIREARTKVDKDFTYLHDKAAMLI